MPKSVLIELKPEEYRRFAQRKETLGKPWREILGLGLGLGGVQAVDYPTRDEVAEMIREQLQRFRTEMQTYLEGKGLG